MRLLSVFGTRPEAIKMAPILLALGRESATLPVICITGQHRELVGPVLGFFGITPDHDLQLMEHDQPLNSLASRAIARLDRILAETAPDRVIVHGDTTTAVAAALAAFHRGIPVAHVEAGLRTYAPRAPFPEELYRRAIDLVSDLHFAPTPGAKANLRAERLHGQVFVTGNSGIDSLDLVVERLAGDERLRRQAEACLPDLAPDKRLLLVTAHRRESLGAPFDALCIALRELADRADVEIVFPVHPNPGLREPAGRVLRGCAHVHLLPPLDLPSFVRAMQRADLILTDSGGVQEEAVALGKPVFVARTVTERPEGVGAGGARLTGPDAERILRDIVSLLDRPRRTRPAAPRCCVYGDGRASGRIVDALLGRPVSEFVPSGAGPALEARDQLSAIG